MNKNDNITNKTGNVRITQHGRASVQTLLQWESNEYYTAECVCVFVELGL
jgi:hypothetical protein